MAGDLLTNADIARQLGMPESTVRYYRDRFTVFLPIVGEGRQRRYRPEALAVFQTIAEGLRNNGTAEQVEATLSRLYPRSAGSQGEPQQQVTVAQQQPNMAVMEAFQSLRVAVETQSQQIHSLSSEVRQLRDQLAERDERQAHRLDERDKALVAEIRSLLAAPHHQTLWQRWFGRNS